MRYAITHVTHFAYDAPVSESHTEARMRPRSDGGQTCLAYDLHVEPRARPFGFADHLGNWVDYCSVPACHDALTITARAEVQVDACMALPSALTEGAWGEVDEWARQELHWDLRHPSNLAPWTPTLAAYAASIPTARGRTADPLSTVRAVTSAVHRDFAYVPNSTRVDSTIDEVLQSRQGVCQDLSHVTVALLRRLGLPTRYISGYIAPMDDDEPAASATHAWIEVLLPELGWVGLDPTNDIEAGERHVRVAAGRDYADVPPTRGVCKGAAGSTLSVSIGITRTDRPEHGRGVAPGPPPWTTRVPARPEATLPSSLQQRQQQQ